MNSLQTKSFIFFISYLKHLFISIKSSYVVFELHFNFIIIAFLYVSKCIICDSNFFFDFVTILFTLRSSFYYFSKIINDFVLLMILNVFSLNIFRFIFIDIFEISFILTLRLHFVFRNLLILLINVVVIILISFLSINVIIFSFFINIFIIIIIEFFVKYDTHNNFDFFFIISIDFLCLEYQLDKFLLNLYIRHLSL